MCGAHPRGVAPKAKEDGPYIDDREACRQVAADQSAHESCGAKDVEETKDILLNRMRRLGGDQYSECCAAS
jgi:hypothetical protein